jgi:hypothetical protein
VTDDELLLLQKAHAASGKLLQGKLPTAEEDAALSQVMKMVAPGIQPSPAPRSHERSCWASVTPPPQPRMRGRFFQ